MYQKSIITFIDILGFKEIVNSRSSDQVDKILDTLNDFTANEPDDDDEFEPQTLSFSDSIIRVRHLESEENIAYPIGHLFHEVNALVHAQVDLINNGVLIRGGISIGEAKVSQNRIFGPGFVAAYELESKYANYPRIILSPELVNSVGDDVLVVNEAHSAEEEREYLKTQLAQGDDGIWFVDYLRAAEHELDSPEFYPELLVKHKNLIVSQGEKHKSLSNVSLKYLWLANYHNKTVSLKPESYFEAYGIERVNVLISFDEMNTLTSM